MKKLKKTVSKILSDAIECRETPCAAILLLKKGEEALFQKAGYADIETGTPISRNSIYRLYSLTKPMTAVAAMTLIESGKLDLLAPVSEFLEGFTDQQVAENEASYTPVVRPVQIRDLFTMTSGLAYPGETRYAERASAALWHQLEQEQAEGQPVTTQSFANRIGRLPLAHQPAEAWMYGTSADILGAVIEVVSGQTLDHYMAESIFAPLNMEDTGFAVPEDKMDRLVTLYERKNGALQAHPKSASLHGVFSLPNVLEGGAGLYSTIDDVMQFGQMLLQGGKLHQKRILSPSSVHWLSDNHLTDQQLSGIDWDSMAGYGYGGLMRVSQSPAQSFSLGAAGEYGWDGWTGTYLSVCPAENLVIVIMQQLAGTGISAMTRKLRNAVYADI